MGRSPCCEKVGLRKGRWTAEEDEILIKYIKDNGEGSWRSLPKNAGLLRCGKSCRLRWINYLRSDLKRGNISVDEEDMIVKLHAYLGNRWSLIASHLRGRTDNEIKNYWNSHLRRKIDVLRRSASSEDILLVVDAVNISMRRGGRPKRRGTGTSSSSDLGEPSLLSTGEAVNEDVPLPSIAELEKETLVVGINEGEKNSEKDITGEHSFWSCNDGDRESETLMQKETETVQGPNGSRINGSLPDLNELLESGWMEVTERFSTVAEERESRKSMEEEETGNSCNDKIAVTEEVVVNKLENNGVWLSLFSLASSFDDSETRGWENLVQVEELWKEDETMMLPSLCEDDDWTLSSFKNEEHRNLVSWLLD